MRAVTRIAARWAGAAAVTAFAGAALGLPPAKERLEEAMGPRVAGRAVSEDAPARMMSVAEPKPASPRHPEEIGPTTGVAELKPASPRHPEETGPTTGVAEPKTALPRRPDAPQQPDNALPGLDDLLGLNEGEAGIGAAEQTGPGGEELQRALSLDPSTDPFEQAVELMGRSATRLGKSKDPGIVTQRMQEETIRKLDRLIDQAQKQQQQRSRSRRQQQQQQQQQQQSSQMAADERRGDNTGQVNAPARQDGPGKDRGTPSTASWGNLPEHVRDALMQHYNDRFSSLYQSMTEAYYRKLAEEPKK